MSTHRKPSRFLTVKCEACDNEQIIYSHVKSSVLCQVCKEELAEPTGGKAIIKGPILNVLS
ncbi:MAG: 30S ribosomal protein S27e [Candidatus Hodarchaeales archaeon]|jgi:small subunit ribosomal protein S27e